MDEEQRWMALSGAAQNLLAEGAPAFAIAGRSSMRTS
jgi:hypothetical protein